MRDGVWRRVACLRYQKEYRVASQSMDGMEHAMAARQIGEAAALLKDIANRSTKNTIISEGDAGISREERMKEKQNKKKKRSRRKGKQQISTTKVAVSGGGGVAFGVYSSWQPLLHISTKW